MKPSQTPCCVCNRTPTDMAHIRSRGAGGGDKPEDTMQLCRLHHNAQHSLGWSRFVAQYPHINTILNHKGWELINELGTIKLRRIYEE